MKAELKIQKLTIEEMLNHTSQDYNPSEWKRSVERMRKYDKLQFYVINPNEVFSYHRFYASYIANGVYFFSQWSAYSSSLTNNGFCMVKIDDQGNVYKTLFKVNGTEERAYARNCEENKEMFRQKLTPNGIMVSSSI